MKKKLHPALYGVPAGILVTFGLLVSCTDSDAKPNFVTKEAPKPGVLAKIGGEEITEEALIGDAKLEFFELKKREYDLRMEQINRLLVEKLIGAEAKKANLSLEEYIDKKVVKGEPKITDAEFNQFVKEKNIPESQIRPDIKERIMAYLKTQKRQDKIQAHVAKLTKGNPVELYFTKPKMNVQVDIGDAPILGKKDAPVTIVEFSDFQCPFCARGAETMHAVKKKYGNKVNVVFKHFPLPMHTEADEGSAASMCVHEQDPNKFWKFHDILFKNQSAMDDESLLKYAKEVGADVDKFKECYNSKKYVDFVQKDLQQGEKLGVKSTPTFIVNGQIVSGALPIESFSEIIDEALAEKK